MNKRQRKKYAAKRKRAFEAIGKLGAEYIEYMLRLPFPLTQLSMEFIVGPLLDPPFGTSCDEAGIVHRTGQAPANKDGVVWMARFCRPETPVANHSASADAVTCLACMAT
jgi:hypothetical protein